MARGWQIALSGFVAIIAAVGTLGAADGPATTTRPASAIDTGRWEAAIRGFQSENFADRDAAQKVLDTATWADAETLRALAREATGAEAKARLENRLQALAIDRLVHPPPITLEIKDAGITELAAALTAATGTEWAAWDRGGSGGPWNLKAQERPLWEVFRSLEKQSNVHVQNSEDKVLLAPGPVRPGGLGPIDGDWTDVVAGDFLIYVGVGRKFAHLQPAAAQPAFPTVKLEYGIRGDPRMRLVRCGIPDILSVVDEKGNVLHTAQPRPRPFWIPATGSMPELNTAIEFADVVGMGKTLTIKGQMVVRMATAIERKEIVGLTTEPSDPVSAGGRTWRMWAVSLADRDEWAINITEQPPGALASVPMSVKVLDAAGKVLWDGVVDRQTSTRVQLGDVNQPLTAVILAARSEKDVIVPFEIKDVPVPPAK